MAYDDTDDETDAVDQGAQSDQGSGDTPQAPAIPPAPQVNAGSTASDDETSSASTEAAAPPPAETPPDNTYRLNNDDLADGVRAALDAERYRKSKWGVDPDRPPGIVTNDTQQRIKAFLTAPDAYSHTDATQAEDVVDPQHQLDDYSRMMKTYSQLEDQHGSEGTSAYAAHKRTMFDTLSAAAKHAADSLGSPWDWAKHMGEALSNVPSPVQWGAEAGGGLTSTGFDLPQGKVYDPGSEPVEGDTTKGEREAERQRIANRVYEPGAEPVEDNTSPAIPPTAEQATTTDQPLTKFMEDQAASRGGKGTVQDTLDDRAAAYKAHAALDPAWAQRNAINPDTGASMGATWRPTLGADEAPPPANRAFVPGAIPPSAPAVTEPNATPVTKGDVGKAWAYLTASDPTTGQEVARIPVKDAQHAAQISTAGFDKTLKAAQDPTTMKQVTVPKDWLTPDNLRYPDINNPGGVTQRTPEEQRQLNAQFPPQLRTGNTSDQPFRGVYNRGAVGAPPNPNDTSAEAMAARLFPGAGQNKERAAYVANTLAAQAKGQNAVDVAAQRGTATLGAAGIRAQATEYGADARAGASKYNADTRTQSNERIAAQRVQAMGAENAVKQAAIDHRNAMDVLTKMMDTATNNNDTSTSEGLQKAIDNANAQFLAVKAAADRAGGVKPQGAPSAPTSAAQPAPTAPPQAPQQPRAATPPQSSPLQRMTYPDGSVWEQRMNPATGKPGWVKAR